MNPPSFSSHVCPSKVLALSNSASSSDRQGTGLRGPNGEQELEHLRAECGTGRCSITSRPGSSALTAKLLGPTHLQRPVSLNLIAADMHLFPTALLFQRLAGVGVPSRPVGLLARHPFILSLAFQAAVGCALRVGGRTGLAGVQLVCSVMGCAMGLT